MRDRANAEVAADLHRRRDLAALGFVLDHVPHDLPRDLYEVEFELPDRRERGAPAAERIEREAAPERLQRAHERVYVRRPVGDRAVADLEAEPVAGNLPVLELRADVAG